MKYCRMASITESETRMGSIRSAAGKTQSASALELGFGWCQGQQEEPSRTPTAIVRVLEGMAALPLSLDRHLRRAITRNSQRIRLGGEEVERE